MYFVSSVKECEEIVGLKDLSLDTYTDFRGDIWTTYTDCDFLPSFIEDKVSVSKKRCSKRFARRF